MLKWPSRSVGALAALFRSLQDIDVYVEDKGSEAFYTELLRRVAPKSVRIARIFPLEGRLKVLSRASCHDFMKRRAIFIVDGDFEWVRGDSWTPSPGVFRLDAYCIENLLVSECAAGRVLMECKECNLEEAQESLDFESWLDSLAPIVDLFVVWACLNQLRPQLPTVSCGIGSVLDGTESPPTIDASKIERAIAIAEGVVVEADGNAILKSVRSRVRALARPTDIVSGKDFLLPSLGHHLARRSKVRPTTKNLRFRLALHPDLTRFRGLTSALERAARGMNDHG